MRGLHGNGLRMYILVFNKKIGIIIPEIQIKLLYFILNIAFSIFFSFAVIEWNKQDPNLVSVASLIVFKKNLLEFTRPSSNSVSNCQNCKGIKCLTRLRLGLSNFLSLNSNIIFKMLWIHFVYDPCCWKKIHIIFFTAPCLIVKDAPSWAQLMIQIVLWQILMIRNWLIFFILVTFL